MTRNIVVAARKNDPRAYGVQKYGNDEDWNVRDGVAPSGVSTTRYLRSTNPNLSELSSIAAWLVEHVPEKVYGFWKSKEKGGGVRCIGRKTEADFLKETSGKGEWSMNHTKNMIEAYGLENKLQECEFLFPIIEKIESDDNYWNRVGNQMLAIGLSKVIIGNDEFVIDDSILTYVKKDCCGVERVYRAN